MAKDENGNRIPTFPYVKFKMVKRIRKSKEEREKMDDDGNEFAEVAETHYLDLRSSHANQEHLLTMKKEGKVFVGVGNMEKLDPAVRAEVLGFINSEIGPRHPLLVEPSVMDAKVEKAKKDRANA